MRKYFNNIHAEIGSSIGADSVNWMNAYDSNEGGSRLTGLENVIPSGSGRYELQNSYDFPYGFDFYGEWHQQDPDLHTDEDNFNFIRNDLDSSQIVRISICEVTNGIITDFEIVDIMRGYDAGIFIWRRAREGTVARAWDSNAIAICSCTASSFGIQEIIL